jgi:hypothetical protein
VNYNNAIIPAITAAMLAGLTAAALCLAAPVRAEVFTMCPDGREGVLGGHTSCEFAANVRAAFYASGMLSDVIAFSPATLERYEMICVHQSQHSDAWVKAMRKARSAPGQGARQERFV